MDWLDDGIGERTIRLSPGEMVFRHGDPVFAVFRVKSGRVRMTRTLEDGTTVVLHTAHAGETFAEAAISASAYHCDGIAETGVEAVAYPVERLRSRLAQNPAAALSFAMFMATQVRNLRSRLELRNIRSAKERLLAWLKMNAAGAPPSVPVDQPWSEVAADIGLTREALYRALSELNRSRNIRRETDRTILVECSM